MPDIKDFPHPLNTPIILETEKEVTVPVMDTESKQIHFEKQKVVEKEEVTYHYSQNKKAVCADKDHVWEMMVNTKRYTAGCRNCMKRLFLHPAKQTIKDGKIVPR
jgi:hypothetical protein